MKAGAIKKQCMAHGGPVKGPGSGTSDSIPIMASDGEYMMPADSVRRIGVKVLDAMKDATHKPAKGSKDAPRKGPIRKMADGGLIEDERKRSAAPGNVFTFSVPSEVKAGVQRGLQSLRGPAPVGGAAPSFGDLVSARANDLTGGAVTPGAAVGPNPLDQRLAAGTAATPPAMDASGFGAGRGAVNPPADMNTVTGQRIGAMPGSQPGVQVDGWNAAGKPNSFTDGTQPGLGARGPISAQNMAAADALAARYAAPPAAQPVPEAPVAPGAGMAVVGQDPSAMFARTPAQQAQDRAFDLSVARTRADSALRLNPGRRGAGMAREIMAGVVEPERIRVAAEGAQLREAGENQRTALREGGANQREEVRAGVQRTNAQATNKIAEANLGINQARLGVEQGRASTEEQSKAALITAQQAFLNAKTPQEKEAAAQALAVLQGRVKETPDLFDRVQTGIDPATGAPVFSIYSKRTGQVQGPAGGPQAPAPGTVKNGYRFKGGNPADQKSWEKA